MVRSPVRVPVTVGVKVTLITQLEPAAKVLPQGVTVLVALNAFTPKSPLAAMLLILSVPVPELVTVTAFEFEVVPTGILPHFSELGERVTAGPPPVALTVRLRLVVFVNVPDVPVIVTVAVPVAAVALADSVNVLVAVVGFGLNAAVTPLGSPDAAKVTLPVKPPSGVTVMVLVPLVPCVMVTVLGDALRLNVGPVEQPLKMNEEMLVYQSKVPVSF